MWSPFKIDHKFVMRHSDRLVLSEQPFRSDSLVARSSQASMHWRQYVYHSMALEMQRHPSGILFTTQFSDYLREKYHAEEGAHPGELLSLEYVSCADGEKAGMSWLKLAWINLFAAPAEHHLKIGDTEVFIHRQSQRGLKNRLLHYTDGQVIVKK